MRLVPVVHKGRLTRGDMLQGHVAGKNFMRCSHEGTCRMNSLTLRLTGVLSPRHVPSIQTDLNSGDMSRGQNFVPATRFFMKIERSHDGICRGDKVAATCPCNMSPRVSRPS